MSETRECSKCGEKLNGPCKTRTTAGSWTELRFYNLKEKTLIKVENTCCKCINKDYVCVGLSDK